MANDKRILRSRFNIPGAAYVFEEFYKREVYLQGCEYISHPEIVECLSTIGKWLENPRGTAGLMLAGNPGNGKTTALHTIGRLISCSEQLDPNEEDCWGKPTSAYLNTYKATKLQHFTIDDKEFNKLERKTLLAIDDFGIEPVEVMKFGNIYTPIIELLEYRYSGRLFTILTTNLTPDVIRERYGDRIADRFNEMMTVVAFPDVNFRTKESIQSNG